MIDPREYTTEEVREMFLRKVRSYIEYWDKESRASESRQKLDGLAHSIMVILDGGCCDMPGFSVVPSPHPSDMEYHKKNGENWFKTPVETEGDIAGTLHEELFDPKHAPSGD